jgi:hypothetical protein
LSSLSVMSRTPLMPETRRFADVVGRLSKPVDLG